MSPHVTRAAVLPFVLLGAHLVVTALRSGSLITLALALVSLAMFAVCWWNAHHLLGRVASLGFVTIAVASGWFAEQMGSSYGWFFGEYHYTDVLGATVGDVPIVIPLMWFALTYSAYVVANLIVWRDPVARGAGWGSQVLLSLLAAMVVTAFDLAADPYFVLVLKAWVMVKEDGWWFGETLQGFVGWMTVSFFVVMCFRFATRRGLPPVPCSYTRYHALVPMGLFAGFMGFQMMFGYPVEVRTVAFFALGIPLLSALAGWPHWQLAQRADAPEAGTLHAAHAAIGDTP